MRRFVAIVGAVVGVSLIVTPFAFSMFDGTASAERILRRFTFLTSDSNPARYLAEAQTTRTGSSQLADRAIPSLALDARLSQGALNGLSHTRLPAFAAAQREIPKANGFSVRYSMQLHAVEGKFQSVYDIPVSGVSLTTVPWLFLVGGLACLAACLVTLRTGRRTGVITILVLGATMVLGPVVFAAPSKAADGEEVKDFATRGLTARAAVAARAASIVLDGLVNETETVTLPYLARRQRIPVHQLIRRLDNGFPAAARFLAQWNTIGPRLARLADAVSKSVDEFKSAKRMPILFSVWVLLGGGLAMSASAGIALLARRQPT